MQQNQNNIRYKTNQLGKKRIKKKKKFIQEAEPTFKPEALWGTLEKISSPKARVSPEADSPNSTSCPTTSAGDEAFLAENKLSRLNFQASKCSI